MNCGDCERLRAEHEGMKRIHQMALLNLNAAITNLGRAQYMMLQTLADEARLDLELVNTEITQHQDRHAIPA